MSNKGTDLNDSQRNVQDQQPNNQRNYKKKIFIGLVVLIIAYLIALKNPYQTFIQKNSQPTDPLTEDFKLTQKWGNKTNDIGQILIELDFLLFYTDSYCISNYFKENPQLYENVITPLYKLIQHKSDFYYKLLTLLNILQNKDSYHLTLDGSQFLKFEYVKQQIETYKSNLYEIQKDKIVPTIVEIVKNIQSLTPKNEQNKKFDSQKWIKNEFKEFQKQQSKIVQQSIASNNSFNSNCQLYQKYIKDSYQFEKILAITSNDLQLLKEKHISYLNNFVALLNKFIGIINNKQYESKKQQMSVHFHSLFQDIFENQSQRIKTSSNLIEKDFYSLLEQFKI